MTAAPVMPCGPQLCSGSAPGKADYESITGAGLWEISCLGCWAWILLVIPASMAVPRIRVISWAGVFSNQIKLLSFWESSMKTLLCENRRKFLAVCSYPPIHQGFFSLSFFFFLIMHADNFLDVSLVNFTLCHCH